MSDNVSDILINAIRIEGLCDALLELKDSDTPGAFQGSGAIINSLQDFTADLVSDLEALEREGRIALSPNESASDADHKAARSRLEKYAKWTETQAPAQMLDDDGAPTDELLDYCRAESLSLDWLFLGDERCLVLGLRRREEKACA